MIAIGDRTWTESSPELGRLQYVTEPLIAHPVGKPQGAPLGVYLSHKTALFIEAYLQANPINEMAGFLVGYAGRSEQRPFITIIGAIEARDVVQVHGGVRFTQETWDYLKAVWQREYTATHVLGWFHSQPGRGLVLSDFNQFTHHRFFERSWQVTFVVDPLQNTSRFYRRVDRKLVPLEDFYLFDHAEQDQKFARLEKDASPGRHGTHASANIESAAAAESFTTTSAASPMSPSARPWRGAGVLGLLLLIFILTIMVSRAFWAPPSIRQAEAHLKEVELRMTEARSELHKLEEAVNNLRLAPPAGSSVQDGESTSTHPVLPATQGGGAGVAANAAFGTGVASASGQYVVEPGDTLWTISERWFGSPYEYARIAEINELTDPNRIIPGMKLRLPESAGTQ